MSYRDDLDAAHARIAALEAELAEALAAREARLAESVRAARDLPTLNEFNRRTPATAAGRSVGRPGGVICPMCLLLDGEANEMWMGGPTRTVIYSVDEDRIGPTDQTVRCPRCRYMGIRIPATP